MYRENLYGTYSPENINILARSCSPRDFTENHDFGENLDFGGAYLQKYRMFRPQTYKVPKWTWGTTKFYKNSRGISENGLRNLIESYWKKMRFHIGAVTAQLGQITIDIYRTMLSCIVNSTKN